MDWHHIQRSRHMSSWTLFIYDNTRLWGFRHTGSKTQNLPILIFTLASLSWLKARNDCSLTVSIVPGQELVKIIISPYESNQKKVLRIVLFQQRSCKNNTWSNLWAKALLLLGESSISWESNPEPERLVQCFTPKLLKDHSLNIIHREPSLSINPLHPFSGFSPQLPTPYP